MIGKNGDVAELRRVAFLPAANGTRLVTADALFARLMIILSPFAFELPAVYLPSAKILAEDISNEYNQKKNHVDIAYTRVENCIR